MRISARQYAQTLYEMTDGKSKPEIEKSVVSFARYIYRNRKLGLAEKIIEQFAAIYNKKKGIVEAEVVTARKLPGPQMNKVKSFVKEKYQADEVVLKNTIDESIKGGMIIRVGEEVADGSVAERLGALKKILSN
ncbi:MAG: ATP synthase F1 subunit delta [Candidatus Moranbacteria bacterium]|nr:ATP synthase F1 subunit delta [Candidatus Moranbacteria bacterium]